jgi:predicted transcriptional regulator
MEEKHINKTELSRLAGVSKSDITQLLSGDHNMRLTTVADLLYALDSKLQVAAIPIDTDGILEMASSTGDNLWTPAKEFMVKESEPDEIWREEGARITRAA